MLQFAKLIPVRTHAPLNFLSICIKFGRADLTVLGVGVVRILLRRSRHRRQLIRDDCDFEMPRSASFGAAHQGQSQPQRCLHDAGIDLAKGRVMDTTERWLFIGSAMTVVSSLTILAWSLAG